MSDPYTQLYQGVWDMLWAHPDLDAAIKDTPSSRIKFIDDTGQLDPKYKTWLDQAAEADLPAVTLLTSASASKEFESSSGYSVARSFGVGLYTGVYNLNFDNHPCAWYITQAMDRYEALLGLEWKGYKYVKRITLGASQDQIQVAGQMQQVLPKGWVTIWDATVLLWFTHDILRGDN